MSGEPATSSEATLRPVPAPDLSVGVTTFGCDAGRSGIGRYVAHVLAELGAESSGVRLEVLAHETERDGFGDHGLPVLPVSESARAPVASLAWHQLALPRWCRRRRWDALFLPAANRRLPASVPCPTVGTVHDLSGLHVRGKYDRFRTFWVLEVLPRLMRRLTRVVTVSESTRRDVIEHARVDPERITVIPLGVDHDRFRPASPGDPEVARMRRELDLDRPYILYVSRLEHPGKGHVRLIEAFCRLKESSDLPHQLVLAGGDWLRAEEIHRVAAACSRPDDVRLTGFVRDDDLPALHRGAHLFVFPSLYEGFGLPILEAMSSAVPVLAARVSSLPEVGGEAARYFEPDDHDELVESMRALLEDTGLRERTARLGVQHARRFTWRRTAALTLDVLRQASEEGR